MNQYSIVFVLTIVVGLHGKLERTFVNPPHCTRLSKTTDYPASYKYDYPTVYIPPGQREAYQHLYCLNPPAVNSAETVVCDWAAPPQIQYTLGDEYVHIVRIDPTSRYLGNAVINTLQKCSHKRVVNDSTPIDVVQSDSSDSGL